MVNQLLFLTVTNTQTVTKSAYLIKSIITLLFFTLSYSVFASNDCNCKESENLFKEVKRAKAVFIGKVESIRLFNSSNKTDNKYTIVKVRRINHYKVEISKTIEVRFTENCAFEMEKGESYLIFGKMKKGIVITDRCTRTKRVIDTPDDIEILKKIYGE